MVVRGRLPERVFVETLSDIELWRRCRDGEPKAWRLFVRRFGPLVWRVALRVLRSEEEARDASQEAFLRIHRSIGSFDPRRPLTPWVARIAANACLRRIEQRQRRPEPASVEDAAAGLAEAPLAGALAADPERAAAERQEAGRLDEALGVLEARDRALLTLRYREGLSDAEVAEAVDMPVGTVKTRIFRARQRLREELADLAAHPGGAGEGRTTWTNASA